MAESLRNGHIDAAFMIAPLAIVLRQQNENVRIVYIGNRHESTLVARKDLAIRDIGGLAGRTLAVPMRYSGHNLAILREMEARGLSKSINIVEMNPPDMASALSSGVLDAYFVGEPFAAQTVILSGDAQVVNYVEDLAALHLQPGDRQTGLHRRTPPKPFNSWCSPRCDRASGPKAPTRPPTSPHATGTSRLT